MRDRKIMFFLGALLVGAGTLCCGDVLVNSGAIWRYHEGTTEASAPDSTAWRTNGFDHSGWSSGQAPFGYANTGDTEYPWINKLLPGMKNGYSSFFLRHEFTVADPAAVTGLRLEVCYDDGYVLWINDDRMVDRNEPASEAHYALASGNHESYDSEDSVPSAEYDDARLDLSPAAITNLLIAGTNVVAVQVFNRTLGSSDAFLDLKLETAVADTKFSHDRGFYDSPFTVTVGTRTPGATIRYTTDGTWPTASHGSVAPSPYTNLAFTVTNTTVLRAAAFHATHRSTDVDTHTYIFVEDVLSQSGMDPNVLNDSRYTDTLTNDLKSLPTMSIVGDPSFVQTDSGISEDYEEGISLALIYPDGSEGFQVNCGMRMTWTGPEGDPVVNSWSQKRSYNVYFKGDYGPTKLRYPLMGKDYRLREFNSLRLRAQGNDKWNQWEGVYNGRAVAENAQFARDEFGRRTQAAFGGVSPQGLYVHLYVNGSYRGLYNPCEKPSESFMASHYGGEESDYDVLKQKYAVVGGNDTDFMNMVNYAKNNNLANAGPYAQMKNYLDIPQFADYVLLEVWGPNGDWSTPTRGESGNNWRAGKKTRNRGAGDPQWTFYIWDYEASMNFYPNHEWNTRSGLNDDMTGTGGPGDLHEELLDSADYRILYADRAYRHFLHPAGVLTPAACSNRYQQICTEIDRAVVGESARWGDGYTGQNYFEPPMTRDDHWVAERNYMFNTFLPQRTGILMTQLRNRGHYPSLDAPTFSQNGGEVMDGFQLTISNPNGSGTIFYSRNGVDPRASGGGLSGSQISGGTSATSVTISNTTTHVKARIKNGGTWSALHEEVFNIAFAASDLRLTEIHYNPLDQVSPYVDGGEFEFLEFKNIGGAAVDLSGFFMDGVGLTFPAGTVVAPGEFLLLIASEHFATRYPGVTNSTQTLMWSSDTGLANGGEKIRLKNSDSNTVLSCEYDDEPPWPLGPDGQGWSLVNVNPGGDPDNPENWRASANEHGSPGSDDPAPGYGLGVIINEVLAHTDTAQGDKIELYNEGAGTVNIGGWYLSDDKGDLQQYQIPGGTTIGPGAYRVFTTNHFGPVFNGGGLSEYGDDVYLSAWSNGTFLGYLVGLDFNDADEVNATDPERPVGWYETSVGRDMTMLQAFTSNAPNADPLVGPVVINEIMYDPPANASCSNEWLELYNLAPTNIDLTAWDLDGIGYTFPAGTIIPGHGFLIVLDTNAAVSPASFAAQQGLDTNVVPVLGDKFTLANDGENLRLEKPNPDVGENDVLVDRVRYNDRSPWPTEADGEGPSLERYVPGDYGNDPINWRAHTVGGTPGRSNSFVSGTAVYVGSSWRYHDRGLDLGTAWRDAAYSDSSWDAGDGVLGYPAGGVITVLSYGPDSGNKYPTYYFRKEFTIAEQPHEVQELLLNARYDDGFVAYLNGTEVVRGGMPAGPIAYTNWASVANGSQGAYETNDITAYTNALLQGRNVLAVELHQVGGGSSDIRWDAELLYDLSSLPDVTVQIAPHGGSFTDPLDVTITAVPTNATIYYTTDGSAPGLGDPTIDSGDSIQLAVSTTVRARGELGGYDAGEDSASFTYVARTARFVAGSSSAEEATAFVNLGVVLSTTSSNSVTLDYAVDEAAGTATRDADFTLPDGTLTIAAGQLTNWIPLQIIEDLQEEEDQTVAVRLTGGSGADVAAPSNHVHTIEDDDGPVTEWIAYNDLMWADADRTENITLYTGWETSGLTTGGVLTNYLTGSNTPVTLAITGAGTYYDAFRTSQGGSANPGTEAYSNFNGIVDGLGNLAGGCTLTFSNMPSDRSYELTVFGNRNSVAYDTNGQNRITDYVLSDVDSFVNASTPGVDILTNASPQDMARYCTGYNTERGYVARWARIDPGSDGTMILTVAGSNRYVNAFKLECRRTAGTSETVKIEKGSIWRYRKGDAEASDPPTEWRMRLFDDTAWTTGAAPIGYGTGAATVLGDMRYNYSCVFYRKTFTVDPSNAVEKLKLNADYDDGFILWVNTEEITRVNVDGEPGEFLARTNVAASNLRSTWAAEFEGARLPQFYPGTNVLCAQLFNRSLDSSDAILDIQLSVVQGSFVNEINDADADNLDDNWEDEQCPDGEGDPAADYDSDGLTTLEEYIAGTEPTNGASTFGLTLGADGSNVLVSFETVQANGTGYAGMSRRYALEQRSDIRSGGIWGGVPGHTNLPGDGATITYTNPPGQNAEYFRARVWLE